MCPLGSELPQLVGITVAIGYPRVGSCRMSATINAKMAAPAKNSIWLRSGMPRARAKFWQRKPV